MKILNSAPSRSRRNRDGFVAVIVMFILLGMVVGFITVNLRVLADLHGEMPLVERTQIRRLEHSSTNSVTTNSPTAALPSQPTH